MKSDLMEWLIAIHYEHFMGNKAFWYSKTLIAADSRLCVLVSNLRRSESL